MRKLILIGALLASAAHAADKPGLSVTIYNDNLALVSDVRSLDLPVGRSRQEFRDVSAQIRAETVTLVAPGVGIVEQNFDYDLLSPDKMMEKAVGSTVTIIRTNPATGIEKRELATVLAVNGGVVLRIGDHIEVLRDDGLPARVIFDKVPDNLRARPTLSVTVETAKAGPRLASLSYLTPGLGWSADYVALFDEAAGKLDLQGWVTLTNQTGTTFREADTVLVAGNPLTREGQRSYNPRGDLRRAGTEAGTRARLGDFYLYPLPLRTTIADKQTKQVSFLDARGASAKKAYEFQVGWLQTADQPIGVATVLQFTNSGSEGLGDQLPAGIVRVYVKDAGGQPQFIGENRIDHTPQGSDIGIATGQAFDVKVKPVVEKREKLSETRWRTTMSYVVSNARPAAVTVVLRQSGLYGDSKVVAESLKSIRRDADTIEYRVPVAANAETLVTLTVETKN